MIFQNCHTPELTAGGQIIEAHGLTKRYGPATAVDRLSFSVQPGAVTGFLGPNGSGKSTTMRLIMGLDHPDAGQVTIGGRPYRRLDWPLSELGGLLEARAFHPGRSAAAHLRALAAAGGIGRSRVDEVLGMAGLADVARRRVARGGVPAADRRGRTVPGRPPRPRGRAITTEE